MEQPFGSDTIDMPGLSYATGAADISLTVVSEAYSKSFRHLTTIDLDRITGGLPLGDSKSERRAQQAQPSKGKGGSGSATNTEPDDEESDDDGDC
eukprot:870053-Prymnesium_polylepis.2